VRKITDRWKFGAEAGTADDGSDKENDDGDVPTIEKILHTTLRKEGFATGARARIIRSVRLRRWLWTRPTLLQITASQHLSVIQA
jgi:hypothetical protein